MRLAIVNMAEVVSSPIEGDALLATDGVIEWIGSSSEVDRGACDAVLDANGTSGVPGFIDSHVHVAFGDYTPRQRTVGFLESYLHGGTTRSISASEVHVPGRPSDPAGVVALAIAAQRCYQGFKPGGMIVHGGSVILEPGLTDEHFAQLQREGVWLGKAGFGAFSSPMEYVPVVEAARRAGLVVMCHTGGGSIAGSQERIGADALIAMNPNVCGHVNGGPTAMPDRDNERIVDEGGDMALQLVHAGNLRSAIEIAERALANGCAGRLLIASDTPTGTGMIPLAMLRTMAELVSLGPLTPDLALAASTAHVAEAYRLDAGALDVGRPADVVLLDSPIGSAAPTWRAALEIGDLPAVGAVVTEGVIRLSRSRNTPPPKHPIGVQINNADAVLAQLSA